jgi:chemotaxis protein MotB
MIRPKTKTLVAPVLGLLGSVKGVKPSTKTVGRRRRQPALLGLGAVGVALVVAGCGSAASTPSTPAQTPTAPAAKVSTQAAAPAKAPAAPTGTPAAAATPTPKATPTAPAAPAAKSPDAGIPQGNGGDADPDNNGGANDGDGPI